MTQPCPCWAGSTWLSRICKDLRALRSSCYVPHKSSKVVLDGSDGQEIGLERALILVVSYLVVFVGSRPNTNAAVVFIHRALSTGNVWLD